MTLSYQGLATGRTLIEVEIDIKGCRCENRSMYMGQKAVRL
jgi:hypothetical protein